MMATQQSNRSETAASSAKTDDERDKERYLEIISKYGCIVRGELKSGARGRGVFATDYITAGEMAMEIPIEHCLFHKLDPSELGIKMSGPEVTEDDKKRLAWASELKLTSELMALLQNAAYEGSGFWAEYWWLLPAPDTKDLPSNFPRGLLEQLSELDPMLAKLVLEHHSRVREAWKGKDSSSSGGIPPVLFWANSMVLSRCFHLWDLQPDGTNNFKGGMCPFIDLINHDFDPKLVEKDGKICAMARRDIPSGEELTHPYTAAATNIALFTRFGFVEKNNVADRLPLPDHIPPLPRRRVDELLVRIKEKQGRVWEERVVASVAGEKDSGGGSGGEDDDDDSGVEDAIMILIFAIRKDQSLCWQAVPEALFRCSGLEDYLAEKKSLLKDCLAMCEALALELGVHLPETAPPSEDACGLVPLEAGGGLGGAADLDWAAALVRGAPDPPPDIYSMLAPRTAEELAAYESDGEASEPAVTIGGEAAAAAAAALAEVV